MNNLVPKDSRLEIKLKKSIHPIDIILNNKDFCKNSQ